MDLSSSGYWINIIPKDVILTDLKYIYDSSNKLTLTDGESFEIDINEFGALRERSKSYNLAVQGTARAGPLRITLL